LKAIEIIADHLKSIGKDRESDALRTVLTIAGTPHNFGGLGLSGGSEVSDKDQAELVFLSSACKINSPEEGALLLSVLTQRHQGSRPSTRPNAPSATSFQPRPSPPTAGP
jgi:hypothetical protein